MKKVAIVGIQGVPAKYGGFETLVENIIGDNCSQDVSYTVFCSGKDYSVHSCEYKGAKLKYIPLLHANGSQSTPYDILSMLCCIGRGYDAVVVLGVSGCLFLPIFRLFFWKKLIVNIDGLEHKRAKWSKRIKKFLKISEAMAVRFANTVIADNKGIQDYVRQEYGKDAALIAYGGDHALRMISMEKQQQILKKYGVQSDDYAISVCRIEPENNSHVILDACEKANKKMIFIGNWNRSEYSRSLKEKYGNSETIKLIDNVYDLDELYVLRSHCQCYIHGHSAGGTNPSLVEAMFFGKPIIAFDVIYNRETTNGKALYFKDCTSLMMSLECLDSRGREMKEFAEQHYTWENIAKQYEALY